MRLEKQQQKQQEMCVCPRFCSLCVRNRRETLWKCVSGKGTAWCVCRELRRGDVVRAEVVSGYSVRGEEHAAKASSPSWEVQCFAWPEAAKRTRMFWQFSEDLSSSLHSTV